MNKWTQRFAFMGAFVILCALLACAAVVQSGSFRYLHQTNQGMAWGTASLSGEATASVTTGLTVVEACTASVDTETTGATAAMVVICKVPTQTSTNRGKVTVNVNNVGDTATGTTKINYMVVGRGGR